MLPEESSTATSGCGVIGVPTVPPPGCTSHASWFGAPMPVGDDGDDGSEMTVVTDVL